MGKDFKKSYEKLKIIEKLKKSNYEVRIVHNNALHMGWINGYNKEEIFLLPYIRWENIPKENNSFVTRIKYETEIDVPVPIKDSKIEKLTNGYIQEFVLMQNHFSAKTFGSSDLVKRFFSNYPLPDEKFVKELEEKNTKKAYSERKIGFK